MVILKELLFESYQNIFDEETKRKYANEVFELLQNAYSKIGGIKGSGFSSPEDMIQNIPFWKLFIYKGKVIYINASGTDPKSWYIILDKSEDGFYRVQLTCSELGNITINFVSENDENFSQTYPVESPWIGGY